MMLKTLNRGYIQKINKNKIILIFHCFISQEITDTEQISKVFQIILFHMNHVRNWNKIIWAAERVLKLFQSYFSDIYHAEKYSWAAIIPLK